MTDIKHTARRYLLGELTEAERSALEETYFTDPQIFAEVAAEENALVDDYVRGRLTPDTRHRFETVYLSRPERRARVEFAQALLVRADAPAASPSGRRSDAGHTRWLTAWLGPRPALAAATLAAIIGGIAFWNTRQSTVPGPESQQAQTSNGSPTAAPPTPASSPAPPTPSVVTLALNVGAGQRSSSLGSPTLLDVPADTDLVRLTLTLRERDYGRYRVIVRAIGGAEIVRQGDLRPNLDPTAPTFTIDVPASAFTDGDYMLTLQGAPGNGEFDDLSQTVIRTVRQ